MICLVVDGIVYRRNSFGGIARYWTETLRALANRVHVDVVLARDGARPAPPHRTATAGCRSARGRSG